MRRFMPALLAALLALGLSGCSALGYFMTPDQEDADLVVVNDSPQVIYAIALSAGDWAETVSSADGLGLLERGESYGLPLEEGTQDYILELLGEDGGVLARWRGRFRGERQELTLGTDGAVTME